MIERHFSALDEHFARLMEDLARGRSRELNLAAKLASYFRGLGHICVPLETVPVEMLPPDCGRLPAVKTWTSALRKNAVVGAPGEFKPLILDDRNRLYLRRYWEYENNLATNLKARMEGPKPGVDLELLRSSLGDADASNDEIDWQKLAVFAAVTRNFCVISGGPGTGKTRTVVRILAALIEQARGVRIRIALTAPTGKAAARLKAAIQKNRAECSTEVQAQLPDDATTIHRLLGSIPDSPYFRHHAANPLAVDVVVVDEASMIDLALMAKLADAVPSGARLILLGDKDQLTSVEAGAVLGDLCFTGEPLEVAASLLESFAEFSGSNVQAPAQPTLAPIHESIVELRKSYRFSHEGGISTLGAAIKKGDAPTVLRLLESASPEIKVGVLPVPSRLADRLLEPIRDGFGRYLSKSGPVEIIAAFDEFRILCALRTGPYGVENLNVLAEKILLHEGVIEKTGQWYHGRPVMITRNDYNLRLFNGDVGLVLSDPDANGELRVFFTTTDGTLRRVLPSRLPAHETVFAMTIHKSQGSEFEQVLMVLPEEAGPIVTRELLYTGVTRARSRVELWHREAVLVEGISRSVKRTSGLRDALWECA